MTIEWTAELAVGIAEIDDAHRELLRRVSIFVEAMRAARGAAALAPLFEFLNDFMQRHFETEERLMREGSYPGFSAHQAEHRQFLQALAGHRAEYQRTGPSATITAGLSESLGKNLRDHMLRTDRALCAFILAAERKARG